MCFHYNRAYLRWDRSSSPEGRTRRAFLLPCSRPQQPWPHPRPRPRTITTSPSTAIIGSRYLKNDSSQIYRGRVLGFSLPRKRNDLLAPVTLCHFYSLVQIGAWSWMGLELIEMKSFVILNLRSEIILSNNLMQGDCYCFHKILWRLIQRHRYCSDRFRTVIEHIPIKERIQANVLAHTRYQSSSINDTPRKENQSWAL